jgi:hypothetical protein
MEAGAIPAPNGVDSDDGQPDREDPQVVADREEALTGHTRQPAQDVYDWPARKVSPQPSNAQCAQGEELQAKRIPSRASHRG